MEAYEAFASVYDLFMEDIEYEHWVKYIHDIWQREHLEPQLVLDLGCGTGNITQLLAKEGISMIGIDLSEDMLAEAKHKAEQENLEILYLMQDMREFELYGTVHCILSLCDSLNYITEEQDLLHVFQLVNNYLHPGGLFIFDLNTEYKFKEVLGQNVFAETREQAAYIWENDYDEAEGINEYYMNFFIKQENGLYERKEEIHYEKAYTLETIEKLLRQSGLCLVGIYDAFTFLPPKENSERVHIVAREVMKTETCDIFSGGKENG